MRKTITDDAKLKAIELYKSGKLLGEVAKEVGISYPTVRKIVSEAGLKINGKGRPKKAIVVTEGIEETDGTEGDIEVDTVDTVV